MRHPFAGVVAGTVGIVVAAGFWLPAVEAAGAKDSSRPSIVVRTYTQRESAGAMRTARRTAGAILGRAGVAVDWVECGPGADVSTSSDVCTQPLRGNELVLRIVPAGPVAGDRRVNTLGFALVDVENGGGSMASVYVDRVGSMAESAGIDPAELLGRAMAHEIGHLLLGTNEHSPRGLMRASWSSDDLRRSYSTAWLFDGREGDVMRSAIAYRIARGLPGEPVAPLSLSGAQKKPNS
jgi:hypothetical protein